MDDELDIDSAGQNVLLATTLATFLLASSAFIWRSNIRNILTATTDTKSRVRISNDAAPELPKEAKLTSSAASSRSKERRRRGKDPAKELMKASSSTTTTTTGRKSKTLGAAPKLPTRASTSFSADSNSREASLSTSRERSREFFENGTADLRTEASPSEEEESQAQLQHDARLSEYSNSEEPVPQPPLDPWAWDGVRKPQISVSRPALSPSTEEQPSRAPNSSSTTITASSTPKRASTPSATPPSSGDVALSTQTQIASLRGALEAARMREEKSKAEVERIAKEVEALRWEGSAWRRREVELQTHIHHLTHQLQGYAALYASLSSPQAAVAPQHLQVPTSTHAGNANGSNNPSPNGYHATLPNSPTQGGALSPLSMYPSPLSPFFGYPVSPIHPHQQQYSVLFPSTSMSSSLSGTSSNGSLSPPENDSPLAAPLGLDRGRRRTRTQTANARIGGAGASSSWGEDDNRDASAGDDEAEASTSSHDDTDDHDEDEGFSELLADAILKRPESIRMASSKSLKKKRRKEQSDEQMEFTFPSLNASIPSASTYPLSSRGKTPDVDDGWLEVEQQNEQVPEATRPLDEKEPIILSYHCPSYGAEQQHDEQEDEVHFDEQEQEREEAEENHDLPS